MITQQSGSGEPSAGPPVLSTLAIIVAAAMFGTLPFFARTLTMEGMAAPATALFRFLVTALVLLPFLRRGAASVWGFAGGLLMGLGWIGFVRALDVMTVAEAGVLFMTYPFFAIAFGVACFGERLTARGLIAALLIVVAAGLIAPWQGRAGGAMDAGFAAAILFALAAPAAYGLLINILVRKVASLPSLSAVASIALGASAGVLPLVIGLPVGAIVPGSVYGWAVLAVFSIVTAMLPQITMSVFAPRVGATRTALAGGAELPTMILVGWLAFGEPIAVVHVVATVLIITAIALAPSSPPRRDDKALPMPVA